MIITENELTVLRAFEGQYCGKTFDQIAADANVPRNKVRRFVLALARKDMLERLPLFDEYTGLLRGSGYSLTTDGQKYLDNLAKTETENVQG